MLTTRSGVRTLEARDLAAFLELTERDPVVNVFAAYRARTTMLDPRWLGGEVWGRFVGGELVGACHAGANLVPIECDETSLRLFSERARGRQRQTATVVGPQTAVEGLWDYLEPFWGTARELRFQQPHLELADDPLVDPDPEVRRCTADDLEALFPACVAMYTEEVGISPLAHGGEDLYRARVRQLISRGWSFARFDANHRVVFKAEVACASDHAAQVQGVWVTPELRGAGLATAGMAAVARAIRQEIAPVASLYVNQGNLPARRAYQRAGFVHTATFGTVLF